jgi:hypothetical protein
VSGQYPTDPTPVRITPPYLDEEGVGHIGFELAISPNPISPGLVAIGATLVVVGLICIACGARPTPLEPPTTVTVVPPPALPAPTWPGE